MKKAIMLMASLALLLAIPGLAESQEVPVTPVTGGVEPPQPGETISLDLAGAFTMALQRNLNLQVGRYQLAAAEQGIIRGTGTFDPAIRFGFSANSSESPTVSRLESSASSGTSFSLGLNQLLPTGTTVSLSTLFRRNETDNEFYTFNPNYNGSLTLNLTQPLLDGFGTLVNRQGIIVAKNSLDQTLNGFEIDVINTLREVETAYWNLIAARKTVTVREQSLELGIRLLDETKERVKVGTSAPIDLVQSEATVADRRRALIYARNNSANAEDTLKAALGFDQPAEWMANIETSDSFDIDPIAADLRTAIETGLENRPEIRQRKLVIEERQLQVKVARNRVLPNLDLTASYGFSGATGTGPVIDPITGEVTDYLYGGFGPTADQITGREFPSWTIGLTLDVPIGNHNAKATLAQARYQLRQSEVEFNALQQQVIFEIRRAVRGLEDSAAAVTAAVASSGLAQRNVEAEQTKFDNGLSTNYQVLQIQEDLDTALLSELQARIDYRTSILSYRVNTGIFLETMDIRIADPVEVDEPHSWWGEIEWLQFVDFK